MTTDSRNAAKTEAVANADAHLTNAGLPGYTDLLAALQAIVDEAGPLMGRNQETMGSINRIACIARQAIAKAGA